MRILLTGGAGFIGRHVHRELVARAHEVIVLDSLRPDVHAGRRDHVVPDLVRGDIRDGDVVDRALRGVDGVVHLAARVGLGVDAQDMPDYADSNVHGTASVLAAMDRAGVQTFVQASSMVVYGEGLGHCSEHGAVVPGARLEDALRSGRFEPPCPVCGADLTPQTVDESTPFDPRNVYAVTKVGQEQLGTSWARSTGGRSMSLRYHNVFGPGMPRDTPYAGVAATFLSALRSGRSPEVYEDGGQRRDFVNVRDVAVATALALEVQDTAPAGSADALNIGSGRARTVGEVAEALAAARDGSPPTITGRYRLGDIRHITADSTAARDRLGWVPAIAFDDGIAELADE